jgi:general secretion pathway protein D
MDEFSINVNESNNALIITASESTFLALQNVIHQLDVRRTQVLIEAIIVEVSAEKFMDLGVNWRSSVPSNDGIFVGGNFSENVATPAPPILGAGLTLGFFNSGQLRAYVRAIARDTDTNFLSTPSLVTMDNHEAEIIVGENIPLVTGSSTGSASSTDNPFQTIERRDIGVILKVTPRVNNDNSMTMTVSQTVENIAPATAVASDIVTSKRQITTTVLIEDDEVLVLGGLIRDDLTQQVSKVPLLGDLPLVGGLFRSTSDENKKRNLMVFLHPRILHRREDNVEVTTKYLRGMNAARQDFLNTTNSFVFPKSLPSITDPLPLELPGEPATDETSTGTP